MAPEMSSLHKRYDTLIAGGGLAGLVTAFELLEAGQRVLLLERGGDDTLGGLALQAFGGMCLIESPEQRFSRVRDSQALAWADWQRVAQFGDDDVWPRKWAQYYIEHCITDVRDWLRGFGLRYLPAVQWVERGEFRPGNSVPRYHVLWGTSRHMTHTLLDALRQHPRSGNLTVASRHEVREIEPVAGGNGGWRCHGLRLDGTAFEALGDRLVVTSGGIGGNLQRVRANWPAKLGPAPTELLSGSHLYADGQLHDAVQRAGGQLTHLDAMWNYAAGVAYPSPHFEGHGLSLIPTRSALWLDPTGRRVGPVPMVTGFDTYEMVAQISRNGWPHTWQVLNRRIARRELAASGDAHNPLVRDRRLLAFGWQMLSGRSPLIDELLDTCPDFIQAPNLPELIKRMDAIGGDRRIDADLMAREIGEYDAQIARGRRLHNDDQLRRIAHLRQWSGDRLRTCKFQRILDPAAGPLIAIRCRILVRKSMGGIQTDLHSRVLDAAGAPIGGLYAAGEVAGFGGGGLNGQSSLEGTFLSGCILTARNAARHIAHGR